MEVSDNAILTVWGFSLAIGVVVIAVVVYLLHQIRQTAKIIHAVAGDIWTQGKLVANNTIQLPIFLATTNLVVSKIYTTAVQIVHGSAAIQQHTEGCPGCPNCILKHK